MEDVRKVMDQNNASISNIYYKALRENASLQGKVVLKMIIDASGEVISVSIVLSELNDPDLEAKLLTKIKSIRFPAANVIRTEMDYTLVFAPR
jgi:TonB family protein